MHIVESGERSVLPPGSQVGFDYLAVCGTQREAKKKDKHSVCQAKPSYIYNLDELHMSNSSRLK